MKQSRYTVYYRREHPSDKSIQERPVYAFTIEEAVTTAHKIMREDDELWATEIIKIIKE